MKLPELKEIAKELGLRGLSAKRKGDLVAAIEEARAKQSSANGTGTGGTARRAR